MISPSEVESKIEARFKEVFAQNDIEVKVSVGINSPSESVLINAKLSETTNYDNHNLAYSIEAYIDFKSAYSENKKDRLHRIEELIITQCLTECWIFTRFKGLVKTELVSIDPQAQPTLKKYYSNKILTLFFRGK